MITVYGRANSSNVQAVMWGIGELGLPYERVDRGHVHGGLDTPEYLAMNPHGLVPVLVDGDGPPIWESAAILRYLGARYGEETFWPSDPVARSQIDKWAEWGKNTFCQAFTLPIFWARVRTPLRDQDADTIARAVRAFEALQVPLADQLGETDFVCGNSLTPADIAAGHILFRYFDMDIERNPHPRLVAYYDLLKARPAFREHVMISYDALRAEGV